MSTLVFSELLPNGNLKVVLKSVYVNAGPVFWGGAEPIKPGLVSLDPAADSN